MSALPQVFGCLVVLLFLGLLGACVRYAWHEPLPGLASVAALLALGYGGLRLIARRERERAEREVARLRAVAAPEGRAWRALLENEGLGRRIGMLTERVRPALRLETHAASTAPAVGQSRIGGLPDLPADLAWPEHDGLPMMFLAQLDLAQVRRQLPHGPLPATGTLWFFYSLSQPWGFDPKDAGASRVIHRPAGVHLVAADAPEGLPAEARFESRALSFVAYEDLPEFDQESGNGPLDDHECERYALVRGYLASGGDRPTHKLLGFADPVQGPMELECQLVTNGIYCGDPSGYADPRAEALAAGQAEWRLLLQVDSDESVGMTWGDVGRLYFWIRESDLEQQSFDRAWLVLQCG